MTDLRALCGSTVRDSSGVKGEILSVSLPWVRIGWWDTNASTPRVESLLRSDPRILNMEILTITEGWVPAMTIIGAKSISTRTEISALAEDLKELLSEDSDSLMEKARSPFKNKSRLGKSVRGGEWRNKKDYWDCSGSNYSYNCKGKSGEVKKIKVKKAWKKQYNKDYKEYNKAQNKASSAKATIKKKKSLGSRIKNFFKRRKNK